MQDKLSQIEKLVACLETNIVAGDLNVALENAREVDCLFRSIVFSELAPKELEVIEVLIKNYDELIHSLNIQRDSTRSKIQSSRVSKKAIKMYKSL